MTGCATWITESISGTLFALGCEAGADKNLSQRTGNTWTPIPGVTGVQVSAYDDATVWVRRADGTLYYKSGNSWSGPVAISGGTGCSSYIAAANVPQAVYSLGCETAAEKSIWRRETNGAWTNLGGAAAQIVMTKSGEVYVTTSAGTSFVRQGSSWVPLPGVSNQQATAATQLYRAKGVGDGVIYEWTGSSWDILYPPTPSAAIRLFTNRYALNQPGQLFEWQDLP